MAIRKMSLFKRIRELASQKNAENAAMLDLLSMVEEGLPPVTYRYKAADEVPEPWLDRCTDNGYERYTDKDGNRRYKDNGELVSDMPFRPCARCGHYPNERGDDHCIQNLGRVVNACCGHGTHDGYVMFDDGTIIRGRFTVERPEEPLPQM